MAATEVVSSVDRFPTQHSVTMDNIATHFTNKTGGIITDYSYNLTSNNFTNYTDNQSTIADAQPLSVASIFVSIILGIVILVIVFGNGMVIIAVFRDRHLKQALQNRLIVSLAAADLCLGIFIMPISLYLQLLGHWSLGPLLCEVWLALDVFLCTCSTLSLVVVSIDRYLTVSKALEYPQMRTSKKVNIAIFGIWFTSAIVSFPSLVDWTGNGGGKLKDETECNLNDEIGYIIYSLTISFYIPVIIILMAYGRIFQVARRRANKKIKLGSINNPAAPKRIKVTQKESLSITSVAESSDSLSEDDISGQTVTETNGSRSKQRAPSTDINRNTKKYEAGIETIDEDSELVEQESSPPPASQGGRKFTLLASRFMHRSNSKEVRQLEALLQDNPQLKKFNKRIERERRATVTIAIIVIAFLVCWLPFSTVYLIDTLFKCGMRDTTGFAFIFWLGYCNSAVNPVLYSIFNRDFRQAFKRLLCKKRRRKI